MKYSVSLPLPKGWQQSSEEFTEEGINLFQLSSELEKADGGVSHIDIIAGAMPQGASIKESALNSYAEFLEDAGEEGSEDDLVNYKFKDNDAWGYQKDLDGDTLRNIFTEILPGVLCMISVSDNDKQNIDSFIALIEKKIAVKMSF